MKKIKLLFTLGILVGALVGCDKADNSGAQELVDKALDTAPLLLNFSDGKEILVSSRARNIEYGSCLLGITDYTYQDKKLDVDWTFTPSNKWIMKEYSVKPEYSKIVPAFGEEAYEATITCTISYEGASASASWKYNVKAHEAINLTDYTYKTLEELNDMYVKASLQTTPFGSTKFYTYGYVTGTYSEEDTYDFTSGVFIQDGKFGLELYDSSTKTSKLCNDFLTNGMGVGDLVIVGGTMSSYSSLLEMKPDFIEMRVPGSEGVPVVEEPEVNQIGKGVALDSSFNMYISSLVYVDEVTYVSGDFVVGNKHATVNFSNDGKTVSLSVNYHIGDTMQQQLLDLQKTWVANESKMPLYGILTINGTSIQIIPIFGVNTFTVHTF